MKIYRSINEVQYNPNRIITVGTFDGVHSGHLTIISKMKELAALNNYEPMVITFEPHPQLIVKNPLKKKIHLLSTCNEKIELLENYKIDSVLIIEFNQEFSMTSPEIFIKEILLKKIGMKSFLIGYDHLFGKDRKGNFELLKQFSEKYNFEIERLSAHQEDNMIVSSTQIRNLISEYQVEEANKLLGYNYYINGKVVIGNQLGRKIGFPTLNIEADSEYKLIPANGVYLTSVYLNEKKYFGMGNIGLRPTLTDDKIPTVEINLFDFDADVYGTNVKAEFIRFIRPETKFPSVDELICQLNKDKQNCLNLIKYFYI
jgi:riboflavin kinase / FMN adenylyltransferase